MNIETLIQKVREIAKAVREGQHLTAVGLILDIIRAIAQGFTTESFAILPTGKRTAVEEAARNQSVEEMATSLESCCTPHQYLSGNISGFGAQAPAGPFIDDLLPRLFGLLKRLLGV